MVSMSSDLFSRYLTQNFPFQPTIHQQQFFQRISEYVTENRKNALFLLTGYAGTGKTTVISTLVNGLPEIKMKAVLMAPTGRAAKVMSSYSGQMAYTIHRKIYHPRKKPDGGVVFTLQQNKHKNTLFIVDESSMIADSSSDSGGYQSGSLLGDLMRYVASGTGCKLLLVGDTAQLPPVGLPHSPALDPDYLQLHFQTEITKVCLEEVMRQEAGSGILHNATLIRSQIEEEFYPAVKFNLYGFKDIVRLKDGFDIQEAIQQAYSQFGTEETSIVVRTNKKANKYNEQIRARILFKENQISTGDLLMVVKNNYFWLEEKEDAGFIANGDIIEVLEIYKYYKLYGFSFVRIKMRMIDYPEQKPFETVIMLDTLNMDTPALSYEASQRLFQEVLLDYAEEGPRYKQIAKVKQNEFFNALQVKFAYAVTCHKAQGGQWGVVFVDQPYLPNGIDIEYLRWLYTAITRAKEKVYLLGFEDDYFEN